MQAIVLAGGYGTRLRDVVSDIPKVLAPVMGRPFLAWMLDELVLDGFGTICIATGYLGEKISTAFGYSHRCGNRAAAITYSHEEVPLGTGGAVRRALDTLPDEATFVLNGDTFLRPYWERMRATQVAYKSRLTIAVRQVDNVSRYGVVDIEDGVIVGFGEKTRRGPGYISAGVYLLDRSTFSDLPAETRAFSMERDVISARLEQIKPRAFLTHTPFLDIGVPEDFSCAPQFIAANSRIAGGAELG